MSTPFCIYCEKGVPLQAATAGVRYAHHRSNGTPWCRRDPPPWWRDASSKAATAAAKRDAIVRCADCRRPYSEMDDVLIPDDEWVRIAPEPGGYGILCYHCICNRLKAIGRWRVPVYLASGPLVCGRVVGLGPLRIEPHHVEHAASNPVEPMDVEPTQ